LQGFLHFIQLERLDDGFNFFHGGGAFGYCEPLIACAVPIAEFCDFKGLNQNRALSTRSLA
jgi:hypothetical protein